MPFSLYKNVSNSLDKRCIFSAACLHTTALLRRALTTIIRGMNMKLDDDIHNYYEHLVLERISKLGLDTTKSSDYLADLCCLALNQVPPRYIRYEVDMAFYLPQSERNQMEMNVEHAISKALKYLDEIEKTKKEDK